ncbi:MAG: DUF1223 domain-containing protein [Roseinatronobacter sp.]|nr:DUF1223 domain-containing protein [Roseinatronobacter sp.]
MRLDYRFRVLLLAALGFATSVGAQENPVLVELFTSQGCAACPPADQLLETLADREDVIALALHVDYWDYIGWTDSFGQPQFSKRQQDYARAKGRASVYTPQMIVGGLDEVKGSSHVQVMGTIATHLGMRFAPNGVRLTLSRGAGAEMMIEAVAEKGLAYAADVQLVRYRDSETVEILAGENSGRVVTYRNIVTAWNHIDIWDGAEPFRTTVKVDGAESVVVVIQEQGQGPVLAARRHR